MSASPLLASGLVVIGDEDGILHAIVGGRWQRQPGRPRRTAAPSPDHRRPSATTSSWRPTAATLYRLEAATGEIVWSIDVGGGSRTVRGGDDATAYLAIDGEIVAIDLDDGTEQWRTTVATTGDVGTPTIAGDLVYAATGIGGQPDDSGIAAVDAATGAVRWRYASPVQQTIYTPAVVDGRAFVLGHDRQVVAMDAASGNALWTRVFDEELEALPSVVGDTVFAVASDGPARALDVATRRGSMVDPDRRDGVRPDHRRRLPARRHEYRAPVCDRRLGMSANVGPTDAIGGRLADQDWTPCGGAVR